jgi:hypothetical protein
MIRLALLIAACGTAAAIAAPAPPGALGQKKGFDKGVKKVEASFTPAEAKPGQTVTFTLTVELNDGYHTYPTVQEDKGAESFVNVIKVPEPAKVIFVGALLDPKDVKSKFEKDLKCNIQYCTGTVVYTHKVVVSPKAAAGALTVKLPDLSLSICDDDNCFPSKKMQLEASLKVLDGPAVPVEKEYVEAVKKVLGEK